MELARWIAIVTTTLIMINPQALRDTPACYSYIDSGVCLDEARWLATTVTEQTRYNNSFNGGCHGGEDCYNSIVWFFVRTAETSVFP